MAIDPWCTSQDEQNRGPSEYSWGVGLTPKHARNAPPDDGGMYAGKAPQTNPALPPIRTGYPGERLRP